MNYLKKCIKILRFWRTIRHSRSDVTTIQQLGFFSKTLSELDWAWLKREL